MESQLFRFLLTALLSLPLTIGFSQVVFPVRVSDNNRFLEDQRGKPFPVLGRTAWCIISQTLKGQHQFIEHSRSFGYNAIEMSAICHWRAGNHAPFNGRGDLPFLRTIDGKDWKDSLDYRAGDRSPDFTTPNPAYWAYLDDFISYCEKNQILVFIFPAYIGYHDGDQGWMEELVANGDEKVKTYGAWIAKRYQARKNLVWMLLGDDGKLTRKKRDAESALIAGLKSVKDQSSIYYSAESFSGQNSAENEDFGKEMTLNGVYSWEGGIAGQARRAYAGNPIMPAYLLEEPYDEEGPDGNNYNPHATQPVRRFQWAGWLGAIGGYISGNGFIWPFLNSWQKHLNTNGAKDMRRLNSFIRSTDWWRLVPSGLDGMKDLIVSGNGKDTADDYVTAACTREGDLLVAYVPPAHKGPVTIDLTALNGTLVASWYDPTSGKTTLIGTFGSWKTSQEFTPPGLNSAGQSDWTLVIRKSPALL